MKVIPEKKYNTVEIVWKTGKPWWIEAEIRQIWNWKWETHFGLTIKRNKTQLVNEYYTFRCEAEAYARWYVDWFRVWWERFW